MSETAPGANPYKIYWVTWGILLVITVAMLAAEAFHMPRVFLVVFLLAFMMVKAVDDRRELHAPALRAAATWPSWWPPGSSSPR